MRDMHNALPPATELPARLAAGDALPDRRRAVLPARSHARDLLAHETPAIVGFADRIDRLDRSNRPRWRPVREPA